jgi:hypothetical protein
MRSRCGVSTFPEWLVNLAMQAADSAASHLKFRAQDIENVKTNQVQYNIRLLMFLRFNLEIQFSEIADDINSDLFKSDFAE